MWYLTALLEYRRLVQVALLLLVAGGLLGVSYAVLAPGIHRKDAGYKFMHCRECGFERPYDAKMAEGKCPMCRPPKVGYFTPTVERVGSSPTSPWWPFRIAATAEVVALMAGLWFTLRPRRVNEEEVSLYCRCPYCRWRLRFREAAAGKPGQCPRCKRFFRFPEESEQHPEDEEVGAE
jgi:hypothetical protein